MDAITEKSRQRDESGYVQSFFLSTLPAPLQALQNVFLGPGSHSVLRNIGISLLIDTQPTSLPGS